MCDAVYGLIRDNKLYADYSGPNEIDVSCVKPEILSRPYHSGLPPPERSISRHHRNGARYRQQHRRVWRFSISVAVITNIRTQNGWSS